MFARTSTRRPSTSRSRRPPVRAAQAAAVPADAGGAPDRVHLLGHPRYLDDIPTEDVRRFEQGLLDYVSARAPRSSNTSGPSGTSRRPRSEAQAGARRLQGGFPPRRGAPQRRRTRRRSQRRKGGADHHWPPRYETSAAGSGPRGPRKQITRATELIATSRIMRAQARATRARPYAEAINEMIEMVSGAARKRSAAGGPGGPEHRDRRAHV